MEKLPLNDIQVYRHCT